MEDIDQLLAQASAVDVLLRGKVLEWASAVQGRVMVLLEGGVRVFLPWDEVSVDAELVQRVEWARVKTQRRAVEKIYRSYNCEVSRLLDLCRQVGLPYSLALPVCQQSLAQCMNPRCEKAECCRQSCMSGFLFQPHTTCHTSIKR